ELAPDVQAGPQQVGPDSTTPVTRLHHDAVYVGQLADDLHRDDADRMLRSGDQDRSMLAEQLPPPAAFAPLLGSGKARLFDQHDRVEIIQMSGQNADLRIA